MQTRLFDRIHCDPVERKNLTRSMRQRRKGSLRSGTVNLGRHHDVSHAVVIGSASASAPMPVPKAPPPGAVMPTSKAVRDQIKGEQADGTRARGQRGKAEQARGEQVRGEQQRHEQPRDDQPRHEQPRHDQPRHDQAKPTTTTNDLLPFLSFVEHFPVGTAVTGVVESYSSHGAYVAIGDVHGYVSLRLMADPPPRSAREAMNLGETVTLVVSSFGAARRSIDLAVPSMAPVADRPVPLLLRDR